MSGAELRGTPELFVGAVVNPGADDLDREIGRMEEKIEAGAAFFQTQAVYDPSEFEGFMRRVEGYRRTDSGRLHHAEVGQDGAQLQRECSGDKCAGRHHQNVWRLPRHPQVRVGMRARQLRRR